MATIEEYLDEQRYADPIEPSWRLNLNGKGAEEIRWDIEKKLGLAFVHDLRISGVIDRTMTRQEREVLANIVSEFPTELKANTQPPTVLPSYYRGAFNDFRTAASKETAKYQQAMAAVLFQGSSSGSGSKSGSTPNGNGGRRNSDTPLDNSSGIYPNRVVDKRQL